MSQKKEKKIRRQLNRVKDKHFQQYAQYLQSMPLYNRIMTAKQIIKGDSKGMIIGIIILFWIFILSIIYSGIVLYIGVKFSDVIIEFVNRKF